MDNTNPINLDFINALTKVLSNYIDQQVDKKVSDVLSAHGALKQIDEAFEKRIAEIADAAVETHDTEIEHVEKGDVEEIVKEAMDNHDFSNAVWDAVNDQINEHDFSDAIESALADYDFTDHIKSALEAADIDLHIRQFLSERSIKLIIE